MMFLIIAALTIGFLGSFHCIGMCGPIAMALPMGAGGSFGKIKNLFFYHFGRSITYSVFGLMAGGIGQSLLFFNMQRYFSILTGLVILVALLLTYINNKKPISGNKIFSVFNSVKTKLSAQLFKQGTVNVFTVGLLNGMLPCGLVYMALSGAAATTSVLNGALFMWIFGISTMPVMLSVSLLGGTVGPTFRQTIKKATPIIWSLMAVLLILRGLNLGIPYVSPKNSTNEITATQGSINCHK